MLATMVVETEKQSSAEVRYSSSRPRPMPKLYPASPSALQSDSSDHASETFCGCSGIEVPMPDLGTVLPWHAPSLFDGASLLEVTTGSAHDKPGRRQPLRILGGQGDDCAPLPGLGLRLTRFLAHGHLFPSLVYECTVEPLGHTVVLKLLIDQENKSPSNVRIPMEVYEEQDDFSKESLGITAMMALSREADMFAKLAPLQGTIVPFSYGFYQFEFPYGHSVVGHVMEYVPSCDIHAYFTHIKHHPKSLDYFMSRLCQAYIELHQHDVTHADAGLRNLRLLPIRALDFVIVDFTASSSIRYLEETDCDWAAVENKVLNDLFEELDEDAIAAWKRSDKGKRLMELMVLNSDELQNLESGIHPSAGATQGSSAL